MKRGLPYTERIMTLHEIGQPPRDKSIAEKSERQHQANITAELARRGLMSESGGPAHVSREAVLDYIQDLEEQLKNAKSAQTPDNP